MKDDDLTAEILLMHAPLAHVLAFVNAREDVRGFVSASPPPSGHADTIPAPNSTTAPPRTERTQ